LKEFKLADKQTCARAQKLIIFDSLLLAAALSSFVVAFLDGQNEAGSVEGFVDMGGVATGASFRGKHRGSLLGHPPIQVLSLGQAFCACIFLFVC
jgi:hypothetical protein